MAYRMKSSPAKMLNFIKKARKAYKASKKIIDNIVDISYKPNPKTYHKKYDPSVTGNIKYTTKDGTKKKISVTEVTKGNKTTLKPSGNLLGADKKANLDMNTVVKHFNERIKSHPGLLNKLTDEFGNPVKR